jgi:hypothetical protein
VTSDRRDETTGIGWYISDIHCRKALVYLSGMLVESKHLASDFNPTLLLEMWGTALYKTLDLNHPSPIGHNSLLAEEILRRDSARQQPL